MLELWTGSEEVDNVWEELLVVGLKKVNERWDRMRMVFGGNGLLCSCLILVFIFNFTSSPVL